MSIGFRDLKRSTLQAVQVNCTSVTVYTSVTGIPPSGLQFAIKISVGSVVGVSIMVAE